ncbi:putative Glycoside-Pentoside-Hexuronide(GPH):CationSymporterFamilyProtein [Monocercomonoides exilis]|uniref:putative Glycoside-Pentoside- Hexuronide(GPH):CationSymporterFamilyProtein n=1 Tax=Monocercomonoides exilis TaxID=2049356 RepID=UPI003559C84B|nr:putative Glycoside-Pentoside-Hexuronide(GPH):CationSymporterFamilyProtein [Monocercomonoides exilis]|eukprot:MONOS_2294.1-p1 / transcript=MONOS_2294.1 / gene=MONOS_2294 / organism=Monocercomonoides_exilis_PA203 / gene_product=Glycoside-Pentoside-Hexuronide(GPH):CationSymporterFamilyProtein / transcript_product=Glycoside-Pentoside-Hexuronide(GPH):CationSymporterFamilyProtein / location=Mono_scaffold00046:149052-151049(-) / protein_length=591 / sequence_SO=supercontig / SO=protein_coding / is_pseudo=false
MASIGEVAEPKPRIHPFRLLCAASSYTSVQIAYGFAFALFSPMMTRLGVKSWLTPIMWLVGPICGLLQPFIGVFSDKATFRFGRRRPFIFVGLAFVLLSYGFFIAIEQGAFKNNTVAIVIGLIAFIIINVAINILMLPARAIVFDVCGEGQETMGNNFIALLVGVGNIISYIFSAYVKNPYPYGLAFMVLLSVPTFLAVRERRYVRAEGEKIENPFKITFRALFKVVKGGPVLRAGFVYLMSWSAYFAFNTNGTLFVAKAVYHGTPLQNSGSSLMSDENAFNNGFRTALNQLTVPMMAMAMGGSASGAIPGAVCLIARQLIQQHTGMDNERYVAMMKNGVKNTICSIAQKVASTSLFSNTSFGAFLSSSFVSSSASVFAAAGTPENDAYIEGVKIGSLAMMAMSLLTSVFSAISELVQKFFGLRATYFLTQLLATFSLFSMWIPRNIDKSYLWAVFVSYCGMAFNFSMFNSVPFAIVNMSVPQEESGVYTGVMNIFCLLGQTISQGMCAAINAALPDDRAVNGRWFLQWDFFATGVVSAVATVCSLILRVGQRNSAYDSNSGMKSGSVEEESRLLLEHKDDGQGVGSVQL